MKKNYYGFDIKKVEEKYLGSKYIGDFEISINKPVLAVFYQPNPKTELGHSNYFGLFVDPLNQRVYIVNAKEILNKEYPGIKLPNGKYLKSTYTHDYKEKLINDVFYMIDGGGQYYCRYSPLDIKIEKFIVKKDKLVKK